MPSTAVGTSRQRDPWRRPETVRDNSDEEDYAEGFLGEAVLAFDKPLEKRRILVRWEVDGATVTADVRSVNGVPGVAGFSVETPNGFVPPIARDLPSDSVVLRLIDGHGKKARDSLRWLVGGEGRYREIRRQQTAGTDPFTVPLDSTTRAFVAQSLRERSSWRLAVEQIKADVRADPTLSASRVLQKLEDQGVSRRTGQRLWNAARDELGLPKGRRRTGAGMGSAGSG